MRICTICGRPEEAKRSEAKGAKKDGWSDGQFGEVCPDCILLDPEGAGEPGDFLDLIESAQKG